MDPKCHKGLFGDEKSIASSAGPLAVGFQGSPLLGRHLVSSAQPISSCLTCFGTDHRKPNDMHAKLVRVHHLKLFFSVKHLTASIISKVNSACVASVSTNNRYFIDVLGIYAQKNDERACEAAAKVLAKKALDRQVGGPLPDLHIFGASVDN
jgi:ribosomal protein L18